MTTVETTEYHILSGPTKAKIAASLFDGEKVTFELNTPDGPLTVYGRVELVEDMGNINPGGLLEIRIVTLASLDAHEGFDPSSRSLAGLYPTLPCYQTGDDHLTSVPGRPPFDPAAYRRAQAEWQK